MKIFFALIAVALTSCVLSACKIVMEDDATTNAAVESGAVGDDDRIAALLSETYDAQLIPHITERAVGSSELFDLIVADIDAAGADHGNRGAGQGAAWNFPISVQGTIVETNLDTRARTLGVDSDEDGSADVTVQLGPVIRGTALRDVAPFYDFNDFRDQIEFAKLARAINDRISASVELPDAELVGRGIILTGVIAIKSADEDIVVTPINLEFEQ